MSDHLLLLDVPLAPGHPRPVGVPKMLPNAKLSHHPRKVNVDQLWLTARRDKPDQQDLRYGEPSLHSGARSIVKDRNVP